MQSLLWAPHPEGEIWKQAQAYYSRHQGDRKTMLCPNTSAAVSWVQGPFSPPAPSPQRWLSQLVVDAELWCVHSPQAGCIVPHLFLFCFFPREVGQGPAGSVWGAPLPEEPTEASPVCLVAVLVPLQVSGGSQREIKAPKQQQGKQPSSKAAAKPQARRGCREKGGGRKSGGWNCCHLVHRLWGQAAQGRHFNRYQGFSKMLEAAVSSACPTAPWNHTCPLSPPCWGYPLWTRVLAADAKHPCSQPSHHDPSEVREVTSPTRHPCATNPLCFTRGVVNAALCQACKPGGADLMSQECALDKGQYKYLSLNVEAQVRGWRLPKKDRAQASSLAGEPPPADDQRGGITFGNSHTRGGNPHAISSKEVTLEKTGGPSSSENVSFNSKLKFSAGSCPPNKSKLNQPRARSICIQTHAVITAPFCL